MPPIGDMVGDAVGDLLPDLLPDHPLGAIDPLTFFTSSALAIFHVPAGGWTPSGGDVVTVPNLLDPGGPRDMDLSAAPPAFVAGGLDGLDAVQHDGAGEQGIIDFTGSGLISAGDQIGVYMIVQKVADGTGTRYVFDTFTADALQMQATGSRLRIIDAGGSTQIGTHNTDPAAIRMGLFTAANKGAKDGDALTSTPDSGGISGADPAMVIGYNAGGVVLKWSTLYICKHTSEAAAEVEFQAWLDGFVAPQYPTIGALL